MHLDKINNPTTFWYEDEAGKEVPFDLREGFPKEKWHAQHSKSVIVQHTICFSADNREDRWLVKLLKWIIRKMPDSWKGTSSHFSMNSTINCSFPIIKYLVEQRKFRFDDACVVAGELCERCTNICLNDLGLKNHIENITYCVHCKEIDPLYDEQKAIWACYKTMRLGGNIELAFKERSPNRKHDAIDNMQFAIK